MISPICWFAAFLVALVALCYSIHLERHNYQHKLFGFEINSNRRIVAFGILALGAFCLFAPVTWAQCFSFNLGEGWEPGAFNFISWVITNFFTVGWTTTIQTGLTDVTSTVYGAIPLGGGVVGQVFNLLYSLLTLAYIIALPVEIGLFAFNAVATRLSGSVIKRHLKYADHAIIFESVDANTELLARDIVDNIKNGTLNKGNNNGDIVLIFCLDNDEDGERQRVLRNLCQGYVRYVFTDTEAADVLATIAALHDTAKHLVAVDVVTTSEETEHNVSATIDMIEAMHREPQSDGTPRITLHCTHKNPDDAQIFDAIKTNKELTCLHLISRVQDEIYDVLEEAPLYSVLEPINISVNPNPRPQNLTVLVVGAGDYGMQAARTTFWMGRMPGVRLNIVVVDPNARAVLEREAARYPEMFGESCDGEPTVHFVEAEAPSIATNRLIAGSAVTALYYDTQNKCVSSKTESVLIPDDARLYAFVTMGDCSQNLSYSLMLQRKIFNRFVDQGTPDYTKQQPVICPHIESEEILEALRSLDKTNGASGGANNIMHPFGARKTFYTYSNIIDDERERLAIQLNAAYDLCFDGSIESDFDATLAADKAVESYNGKESNKSSSRASAAHIPYRFWALGFSDADVEQGSFEHAWREKLQGKVKPASNNDNIANAILSSVVPDAATKAEFDASEQKNREEFALICRLGDMEHDRWLAYCRATGMTELGHGTVEQEREQRMRAAAVDAFLSGKHDKSGAEGVRKSDILMRHAYMTPDNDVLGARGFLLGKNVYAYDRIIVALSARIAKGSIVKD